LGDYLIVAVTASDFDQRRGKINVRQSLAERMEAVRALNIADEIIVEEYEGQKIDDICRTGADIFTVGSDWEGKFDYLKEYCKVIYLPRTEGVSSSGIRQKGGIRLGLAGDALFLNKIAKECQFVNGVELAGIYTNHIERMSAGIKSLEFITNQYDALLDAVDAVYIHTSPHYHYRQAKEALKKHKHVLCHSPIALKEQHARELLELAGDEKCVLLDGIKTAYSTAFERMLLLLKSGLIGRVVSVDATCTRLKADLSAEKWTNLCAWGPIAMLPVFKILGTRYLSKSAAALFEQDDDILWWAITGAGGSGKSRLAYDFAKKLEQSGWKICYYTRYMELTVASLNDNFCKTRCNLLIVVDNDAYDFTQLARWIFTMDETNHSRKIRILIIQRISSIVDQKNQR